MKGHDLIVKVPQGFLQGATFKLSPRNLDDNELNMSVKLPAEEDKTGFEDRGIQFFMFRWQVTENNEEILN